MQISKPFFAIKQVHRSVACLMTLDAFFSLLHIGTHLLAPEYLSSFKYWDLDFEGGIATWYSMLKFMGIALVAALFVHKKIVQGQRSPILWGLPTIFLAMGIDEVARLHERIGAYSDVWLPAGSRANTPFQETGIWIFLVGIPFITFFLWWVSRLRKTLTGYGTEIKMLVTGVTLLLLGALGVELLSNFFYNESTKLLGIALEEGLEMFGATVIFWSVLTMLHKRRRVNPFQKI